MIKSFHDRRTAALLAGKILKGIPADLVQVARRKLQRLHEARTLDDLRRYPKDDLHLLQRGLVIYNSRSESMWYFAHAQAPR